MGDEKQRKRYDNPHSHFHFDGFGRGFNAFTRFDDLFEHDPFFNAAFDDMDDLFAKHFGDRTGGGGHKHGRRRGRRKSGRKSRNERKEVRKAKEQEEEQGGFFSNLMSNLGINFNVQFDTRSSSGRRRRRSSGGGGVGGGNAHSSSWSFSSSGGVGGGGFSSSFQSMSTRTVVENGRQVTVRSMERDGNRIEEKYVGDELIERRINGELEAITDGSDKDEM